MPSKALVVDANILVRAVLGKRVREVIETCISRSSSGWGWDASFPGAAQPAVPDFHDEGTNPQADEASLSRSEFSVLG
jgi:hypothetical protein